MGPELWYDYLDYSRMRDASIRRGSFEFAEIPDMPSATILPLCMFIRRSGIAWTPPGNERLAALVSGLVGRCAEAVPGVKTDTGLIRLPEDRTHRLDMNEILHATQTRADLFGGENAFMFVVGELVDNWNQHSQSKNSYILARSLADLRCSELSIIDDGITVGGSFRKAGMEVENDMLAVKRAVGGLSSKSREERGYGLYSTLRILTEGLHGTVLVVSGGGALERTRTSTGKIIQKTYHLGGSICGLEGTLVSARMPMPAPKLDIYDYTG